MSALAVIAGAFATGAVVCLLLGYAVVRVADRADRRADEWRRRHG